MVKLLIDSDIFNFTVNEIERNLNDIFCDSYNINEKLNIYDALKVLKSMNKCKVNN